MENQKITRRPIRARDTKWAAGIAHWLTKTGMRPNQISILSVVCASLAGACLVFSLDQGLAIKTVLLIGAAGFIQLRLLCNLFDGMVAVEGGFRAPSGEIYNEFPDRISDVLILVCAGYSIPLSKWGDDLGWAAAVLAVITAYVRTLGGSVGVSQPFCGPMAKQQRMAVITIACLATIIESIFRLREDMMLLALMIIVLGCTITILRRAYLIIKELEKP